MKKEEKKIYFASFQKRAAANAVDFATLSLILLFVVFLVPAPFRFLYALFLYVYLILTPIIFRGQSLGKLITKIKIVTDKTYEEITILQAHLREIYKYIFVIISLITSNYLEIELLRTISNISLAFALLTFVVDAYMVIEQFDKRGMHDKMTNTIVIDLNYHFDHSIIHDEYEESYFFKTKK